MSTEFEEIIERLWIVTKTYSDMNLPMGLQKSRWQRFKDWLFGAKEQ